MRKLHLHCALLSIVAAGSPAMAAEPLRELCPARPGLGTAPCIVDRGHVLVEIGLADWTIERDSDGRTDTVIVGDTAIRYGVTDRSEVQIGWTALGFVRTRQSAPRTVEHDSGTGDVTVAFKQSLRNPDGSALSIAVQPFVTLPTGGKAIGAGDWGGGLLIPMSNDLSDTVQVQLTPEIDAAADSDGHGRHLAYGAVAGLGVSLSDSVSVTVEGSAFRDADPDDRATELLAAASLAWQPGGDWQVDVGTAIGLNRSSPDAQFSFGVARRF